MSETVEEIPIERIEVGERLRVVDHDAMVRIARSMSEQGLITPIEVIQTGDEQYRLVAGAHRLGAAHELGWGTIRAVIFRGSDLEARLREIDENLHRAELTPFDEATFLGMRWYLWEQIHGAPARGDDRHSIDWRGSNLQVANLKKASKKPDFFRATADALGVSESTVRRAVKRRVRLDAYWSDLRDHKDVAKGTDLDALVRLPPSKLEDAIDLITLGEPIDEAVSRARGSRKQRDENEAALKRLMKAWNAASAPVRNEFLSQINATAHRTRGGNV